MAEVRALQDVGQFTASIDELREILAISPDLPEASYRLGVALVQTGEPSRAVWALRKASESPSYAIVSGLLLASAQLNNQNYEEVVRATDRVLEIDPNRQVALQLRAKGNLGAGQLEAALEDSKRLVELYPDDYSVAVLYATVLLDSGHPDEAKDAHDRIKELGAQSGDPAIESRGCLAPALFAHETLEDDARATELFEDCVTRYPSDSFMVTQSMKFFDEIDRRERSTQLIRAAVELAPESLALRSTLANRLAAGGDAEAAEAVLQESVESFNSAAAWNMLASFHRRQGNADKALTALEKVIELSRGGSDQLRFTHADILVDLDELDRAEEVARTLGEPTYAKLIVGRIQLKRGDARAALESFDQGIRNWPNNAGARYLAGLAARELGDFDRAISEFREAVRADKTATDAALVLALIHFKRGEYRQARNFAATALDRPGDEKSAQAYVILIRALSQLELYDRARHNVELLSKLPGQEVHAAIEGAQVEARADSPAAAADALRKSRTQITGDDDLELVTALVSQLQSAERNEEALAEVDAALGARPESARLHQLRGSLLANAGREAEANSAFEKALAIDPEDANATAGLATLAAEAGQLTEAIALFAKAAELSQEPSAYIYSAGQLAWSAGDAAAAEMRFREVVRIAPGHAGARNDLAWLLAERGQDLDLALALAQEARRIDGSPAILDTLGWVHLKRGETQAAVTIFQEALEAEPDSASIRYRLGVALGQAGNADDAREMLQGALDTGVFPEAEDARRELAQLDRS
jgi:tetratricopeptide (TPR) repeat protein